MIQDNVTVPTASKIIRNLLPIYNFFLSLQSQYTEAAIQ